MYCWSCGHANPDTHKFCGECGKSLFKPEKVVSEITASKNFKAYAEQTAPEAKVRKPEPPPVIASTAPPLEGVMLSPPVPPPQSNPLVEEPRVVHDDPVATAMSAAPVRIHDRVPNRITGPSFLGLSDEPGAQSSESSYLLEDESDSGSSWRGYVMLAAFVILGLLVIRNWADVRTMAASYGQKLGLADSQKHTTLPERVTASNDAATSTPDTAPTESNSSTPAEKNDTTKKTTSQQTAKLEKPQNDAGESENPADKDSTASADSPEPAAKQPTKDLSTPRPVYDNSQLEEAQKYLQGRGVPQDCNRGLNLLRSAAKQPNPKARTQMAALYVSGHCVSEDLAQAYNWFARAQELEPHNRLIERNLDSLWARMSDEQRRQVLR